MIAESGALSIVDADELCAVVVIEEGVIAQTRNTNKVGVVDIAKRTHEQPRWPQCPCYRTQDLHHRTLVVTVHDPLHGPGWVSLEIVSELERAAIGTNPEMRCTYQLLSIINIDGK